RFYRSGDEYPFRASRRAIDDRLTRTFLTTEAAFMIRPLCTVVVAVILASGVQHGRAQSPPVTPSSQAALDEAERLSRVVAKLYGEGKFQEAIPPAERSLALREQALGPMHADV